MFVMKHDRHTPRIAADPLLAEIERFLARTGMGPSFFGKQAVGNSELVKRLRSGRDVTRATEKRVLAFIAEHSPRQPVSHGS